MRRLSTGIESDGGGHWHDATARILAAASRAAARIELDVEYEPGALRLCRTLGAGQAPHLVASLP